MKIVINSCYGGFSISPKAVKRLAELHGQKAYFFELTSHDFRNPRYSPVKLNETRNSLLIFAFSIPNPNEVIFGAPKEEQNDLYNLYSLSNRFEERTNPLLIQVVEELGKDANGQCAELTVLEIPDDVQWEIEEYDGMEWVAEKHRTWR
jgi:hypothetical protein